MVFAETKRRKFYIFRDMLFQPDKSDFILVMIKEVEAHEAENIGHS